MAFALGAQLRALTGNRWAMAGLAGAAGLGAVALARSRGAKGDGSALGAGTGATADAGDVAGAAFTGQSFPSTSATDLAVAVGDLDSKWADELAGYSAAAAATATSLAALTKADTKQQTSIDKITKAVAALQPKPAPKVATPKKTTTKKSQSISVKPGAKV